MSRINPPRIKKDALSQSICCSLPAGRSNEREHLMRKKRNGASTHAQQQVLSEANF